MSLGDRCCCGAVHQTSAKRLIMKAPSFIPSRRLAKNNWQVPRSLPLCHQGQVNDNADLLRHKRKDSTGGNKNRKGRLQSRPSVCSFSFFLPLCLSVFPLSPLHFSLFSFLVVRFFVFFSVYIYFLTVPLKNTQHKNKLCCALIRAYFGPSFKPGGSFFSQTEFLLQWML